MNGLKRGLFDECLYWRKRWREAVKNHQDEISKIFYHKFSALYDVIVLCSLDDEFTKYVPEGVLNDE